MQTLPGGAAFRANIWGMKSLGVERILSLSAVGLGSKRVRVEMLRMQP